MATNNTINRKRRSSILKTKPRAPLAELEFNPPTPETTSKSRRVSFSRRTGVAEFVMNEATTTWRNLYEEQNKTLESSSNDSDAHKHNNQSVHAQFQEVEAEIACTTLGNPAAAGPMIFHDADITAQLAALDNITETKQCDPAANGGVEGRITAMQPITAPSKDEHDDLSDILKEVELTNHSHAFVGDLNKSCYIEVNLDENRAQNVSDMSITDTIANPSVETVKPKRNIIDWTADKENIVVDYQKCTTQSTVDDNVLVFNGRNLTVANVNDDLDDILKDIPELPKKSTCDNTKLLSSHVSENTMSLPLHIVRNTSMKQMSIIDNISKINMTIPPEEPTQMKSYRKSHNMSMMEELGITELDIDSPTMHMTEKISEIHQEKSFTLNTIHLQQTIKDDTDIIKDCSKIKTTLLNQNDPTRFEDSSLKGVHNAVVLDMVDNVEMSTMHQILSEIRESSTHKTFEKSEVIGYPDISIKGNETSNDNKGSTSVINDNNQEDMSTTQTIPSLKSRETLLFGNRNDDLGDLSMTQVIPTKINAQVKRQTIIFDGNDGNHGDLSFTMADMPRLIAPILINDKNPESSTKPHLNPEVEYLQSTETRPPVQSEFINRNCTQNDTPKPEVISSNVDYTLKIAMPDIIGEKGVALKSADRQNDMSTTEAIQSCKSRETLIFSNNDDLCDLSMTQTVPTKITAEVKRQTIIFDNRDGYDADLSMTMAAIPTNIFNSDKNTELPMQPVLQDISKDHETLGNKDQITVFQADMSTTLAVPAFKSRETLLFTNNDNLGDLSMTQAISSNILGEIKRRTIMSGNKGGNDGDLSMTIAIVPTHIEKVTNDKNRDVSMKPSEITQDDLGAEFDKNTNGQNDNKRQPSEVETISKTCNDTLEDLELELDLARKSVHSIGNNVRHNMPIIKSVISNNDNYKMTTLAVPSNYNERGGENKDDGMVHMKHGAQADMSVTEGVPAFKSSETLLLGNNDNFGDLSMTQAIPSKMCALIKRQTIIFDNNGDLSITESVKPTQIEQINKNDHNVEILNSNKQHILTIETNADATEKDVSHNIQVMETPLSNTELLCKSPVSGKNSSQINMSMTVRVEDEDSKMEIVQDVTIHDKDSKESYMQSLNKHNLHTDLVITIPQLKARETYVLGNNSCLNDKSIAQTVSSNENNKGPTLDNDSMSVDNTSIDIVQPINQTSDIKNENASVLNKSKNACKGSLLENLEVEMTQSEKADVNKSTGLSQQTQNVESTGVPVSTPVKSRKDDNNIDDMLEDTSQIDLVDDSVHSSLVTEDNGTSYHTYLISSTMNEAWKCTDNSRKRVSDVNCVTDKSVSECPPILPKKMTRMQSPQKKFYESQKMVSETSEIRPQSDNMECVETTKLACMETSQITYTDRTNITKLDSSNTVRTHSENPELTCAGNPNLTRVESLKLIPPESPDSTCAESPKLKLPERPNMTSPDSKNLTRSESPKLTHAESPDSTHVESPNSTHVDLTRAESPKIKKMEFMKRMDKLEEEITEEKKHQNFSRLSPNILDTVSIEGSNKRLKIRTLSKSPMQEKLNTGKNDTCNVDIQNVSAKVSPKCAKQLVGDTEKIITKSRMPKDGKEINEKRKTIGHGVDVKIKNVSNLQSVTMDESKILKTRILSKSSNQEKSQSLKTSPKTAKCVSDTEKAVSKVRILNEVKNMIEHELELKMKKISSNKLESISIDGSQKLKMLNLSKSPLLSQKSPTSDAHIQTVSVKATPKTKQFACDSVKKISQPSPLQTNMTEDEALKGKCVLQDKDSVVTLTDESLNLSDNTSVCKSRLSADSFISEVHCPLFSEIDELPFMGTWRVEWAAMDRDWSFLVLYGHVKLTVRFDTDAAAVGYDTPVKSFDVVTTAVSKHPMINLCATACAATVRGAACARAADVPALLSRCARAAADTARWGRAMQHADNRLACRVDGQHVSLEVANVPLRRVWSLRLRVECTAGGPRARDVLVDTVAGGAGAGPALGTVLADTPGGWDNVPATLWKVFRFLKNMTPEDELMANMR